ncbi:TnaB [Gallibacterium genomosp. 3]|uniref:Aromatic amino acid permease n=1 Tax=Gallibacterium genomosp. 3 TaxID=505345 RepID=A0A1A7PND5_9PAST|nr:aromatic amino acid transport family protein [Gallibacterium genomosp. 3]OBX04068.1 TnaB [Gallibacterium genomosp. 3]
MKKQPSILGGGCIIASVCVGAGMLGLPTAGAGAWTVWTKIIITMTMITMVLSGWLLLEAYKSYDIRASFNTVTKDILGKKVNLINNVAVYFVGGILLYAYTTSAGLIIQEFTGLNNRIASIVFVIIFSSIVWHSTRAVDRISVLFIVTMVGSFIFGISGLLKNIEPIILFDSLNHTKDNSYFIYTMALFPVALTSFGYHHSVSSMRSYYGEEKRASYAILVGAVIALCLYLIWIISIFGNLPRDQFSPVLAADGNIDILLQTLGNVIDSEKTKYAINIFSIAAILSSFVGVGLGVFDFLADFFQFSNDKFGRSKSWLVTFLPPLILSVIYPLGFLKAIGYAGAIATIWTCIIPASLAFKVRQKYQKTGFITPGGMPVIIFIMVFGILTALFHCLAMFNLLPVLK